MTLTDTQLAEIRAYVAVAIARTAYSFPPLSVMMTDAADDLLAHIASLESQLSTIRKEATDVERERAAGIAERKGDLADGRRRGAMLISDFTRADQEFKACLIALEIAQAIRAPTGDEGK